GRFPGWAQLIANLNNQNSELQQNVNFLTERLSNDPKLSDALHEVISTVTAIRSTASILADTRELEPEWLMRFHRNINEDGKRLAQGAETLVKYLEGGPNADSDVLAPVEEVEAFLAHHSYHFAELEQDLGQEGDAEQCLDQLIAESDFIVSEDATHLARRILGQYVCDAQELPIAVMADLISMHKIDPETIIRETGAPMAQVLRRIAMLPEQITGATGLVSVTTSGMLLPRKPMLGINLPRTPTGCAFWPLHRVMAHPERPVRAAMRQDEFRITAMAAAEQESAAGFDTSGTCTAYMLLLPEISAPESNAPLDLKEICSVCGRKDCVAPH
ncbi:MAG: transcriptional regulator, partial [Pseudomonadota bacterium]